MSIIYYLNYSSNKTLYEYSFNLYLNNSYFKAKEYMKGDYIFKCQKLVLKKKLLIK